MRAIWSGEIAFGLVNVPVKAYSATQSHEIAFHQVHDADGGRIRYERKCDVCGEPVEFAHIEKAYEEGGRTVVLTAEELQSLPAEEKDEIEVVQFVPGEQIDPIRLSTPYFLEPVGKSPKSYVLLRDTLVGSELTAVVRFTLRSKTRLGVLRAQGDVLVLQTLLWDDDIREADFPSITKETKVSDKEMQMATALVEQFAGDFHPEEFTDDYQEELRQLIDAKLSEGDALDTAATFGEKGEGKSDGTVVSLMEALERSLQRRKAAQAGATDGDDAAGDDSADDDADEKPAAAKKAPAKKAAAKKAPAKKAAEKETPAKKTAARKSA